MKLIKLLACAAFVLGTTVACKVEVKDDSKTTTPTEEAAPAAEEAAPAAEEAKEEAAPAAEEKKEEAAPAAEEKAE